MPNQTLTELLTQYRQAKVREAQAGSANISLESNLIAQAITGFQITEENVDQLTAAISDCYMEHHLVAQLIANTYQQASEVLERERNYVSLLGDREVNRTEHKLFTAALASNQFSLAALLYEKSTVKPVIPEQHLLTHLKALRHAVEINDSITMGYIIDYVKALNLDQTSLLSTIGSEVSYHGNNNFLSEVVPQYYSLTQVLDSHVDLPSYGVWVSLFNQATPNDFKACANYLTRVPEDASSEILFSEKMPIETLQGIWTQLSPTASHDILKLMIKDCSRIKDSDCLKKILKFELFKPSSEQYQEYCCIAFSQASSSQYVEELKSIFKNYRELSPKADKTANCISRLLENDVAEFAVLVNDIDIEGYIKAAVGANRISHLEALLPLVKDKLSDDTKQLIVQKSMFLKKTDLLKICIDNQLDLSKSFTETQYKGRTPLEKSVIKNNSAHLEMLVRAKANIDVNRVFYTEVDPLNTTSALSYFMESKYFNLAELLLNRNDIDAGIPEGKPFFEALRRGEFQLALKIYEKSVIKPNLNPVESQLHQKALVEAIEKLDTKKLGIIISYVKALNLNENALLALLSDVNVPYQTRQSILRFVVPQFYSLSQVIQSQIDNPRSVVWFKMFTQATADDFAACAALISKYPEAKELDALYDETMPIQTLQGLCEHLSAEFSNRILSKNISHCLEKRNYQRLEQILRMTSFAPTSEQYDILFCDAFTYVKSTSEKEALKKIWMSYKSPSAKAEKTADFIANLAIGIVPTTELAAILHEIDISSYIAAAVKLKRYEHLASILSLFKDKMSNDIKQFMLEKALTVNETDLLKLCIDNQFNLSETFSDGHYKGKTILEAALQRNPIGSHAALIIQADTDIQVNRLFNSMSALSWCVPRRDGLAELLLQRNDIDVSEPGNLPLLLALESTQTDLAKAIFKKDPVKVKLTLKQANRFINDAISYFDLELLDFVLSLTLGTLDLDPKILDKAVMWADPNALDLLVSHGINPIDIYLSAAKGGQWDIVHSDLTLGLQATPETTYKLMLLAIEQGRFDEVEYFLTYWVDASSHHSEALRKAIISPNPNPKIVQALLDAGADPKTESYQLPFLAFDQYRDSQNADYLQMIKDLVMQMVPHDTRKKVEESFAQIATSQVDNDLVRLTITDFIKDGMTPTQAYAFDYLNVYTERRRRQTESESESSMALTTRANQHFDNNVKPLVAAQFAQVKGATDMEKVVTIEQDIKGFLLDTIASNCRQFKDDKSQQLQAFIVANRTALIEGKDRALLNEMRAFTSNNDAAHLAWRAYDPFVTRDPTWEPLLCSSKGSDASNTARTRVAMYYLAKPDPTTFIAQLADMERAPGHSANTETQDSFTCFPGAVGRIARMGENHAALQLPPSRDEKIQDFIEKRIFKHYDEKLKVLSEEDQEVLCYALTGLTPNTAIDIINDVSNQRFPQKWLAARKQFITELGDINDIIAEINQTFVNANEEPLSATERYYIECDFTDIGGSGRNASLIAAYEKLVPQEDTPVVAKKSTVANPFHFSFVDTKLPPTHHINKMNKYIEFELLYPTMARFFSEKGVPEETTVEWLRALINEVAPKAGEDNVEQKFKDGFDHFLNDEAAPKLTTEEQVHLKVTLFNASLAKGITKSAMEEISRKLTDETMPKDEASKAKALDLMNKLNLALAKINPLMKIGPPRVAESSHAVQVEVVPDLRSPPRPSSG